MPVEIMMPNLGFDAQESRLIEWLKTPGETVRKGEPLAVIESDKANVELESVADGVLIEHCYAAGESVPVGDVIARIAITEGEASQVSHEEPEPSRPENARSGNAAAVSVEASPLARRMADEHGISLAQLRGSGPRGRITREDVERHLSAQSAAPVSTRQKGAPRALPKVRKAVREAGVDLVAVPATGKHGQVTMDDLQAFQRDADAAPEADQATTDEARQLVPLSRVRRRVGERLASSKREAPHFYVTGELDIEAALLRLRGFPSPRPRINDLIQYLTVRTLRQVPELNATFEDGELYRHQQVDLAIAVALDDGLLTPVIQGAERYSLTGLAQESRGLIQRARENRLQMGDLAQGTFTISNLGVMQQVDRFVAVINPPQVAILAVGAARPRPVVRDGGLHIRHTVYLTLSGDHRVVDGMHLGRFLAAFQDELEYFNAGRT